MHDSLCKFPSKGWTKCSLNRLLKDACDISDLNSESSVHGEAFRRASLTRSLISGEHDCVHAWRWWGMILNICCKQPVFFQRHPTTKTGSFQSHPQCTEENALHFTYLACGSFQHIVGTQKYSYCKLKILYTFSSWILHLLLFLRDSVVLITRVKL